MRLALAAAAACLVVGVLLIGSLPAPGHASSGTSAPSRGVSLADPGRSAPVAAPAYPIVFNETGLPAGTTWGVTLNGTVDGAIGNFSSGPSPKGLLVDPQNGHVYVALSGADEVGVFDANGTAAGTIAVGQDPMYLALDPTSGTLYVTDRLADTVSVIDTANDTVVGTVAVGQYPVGIAFDPVNGYLYVADAGLLATEYYTPPVTTPGQVTVINAANNTVVTTLTVGSDTRQLSYDPLNGIVYVANYGSGNLTEIATSDDAIAGSITLGGSVATSAPAVDLATGNLYVSENQESGTILEIAPTSGAILATAYVGAWPAGPYYDPSNGLVYVGNEFSNNVSVLNGSFAAVVGSIPAGDYPAAIASDLATGAVYIVNWDSNGTLVVDGSARDGGAGVPTPPVTRTNVTGAGGGSISFSESNGTYSFATNVSGLYAASPSTGARVVSGGGVSVGVVFAPGAPLEFDEAGLPGGVAWNVTVRPVVGNGVVGNFSTGPSPLGMLFDPQNDHLYVALSGENAVGVYDLNGTQVGAIPVGSDPRFLALDPSHGALYVTNRLSDNVSVINVTNATVVGSVDVGLYPVGIDFDPANGYLYVADSGLLATWDYTPPVTTPGQVTVINTADNSVVTTLTVGSDTRQLSYDPLNGLVYVTNYGFGNLTVINTTTNTVTGQVFIGVGLAPSQPSVDTANGDLYIADNDPSGSVFVYDPANGSFVARVPVGAYPARPLYDPANGLVYVGNEFSGNVSVISTANNTIVGSFPAGDYPAALAADPAAGLLFVGNWFSNDTTVVNTSAPGGGVDVLGPGTTSSNVSTEGGGTIFLGVPQGTYAFSVGPVAGFAASPESGTVRVNGSAIAVPIDFGPTPNATLEFSVTAGLARGALWSVTLGGTTESSRGSEITFTAPVGAHPYAISGPSGTRVVDLPITGVAVLDPGSTVAPLTFARNPTHLLRFVEHGLSPGTSWCVTVGTLYCSETSAIRVGNLPAGSYTYEVDTAGSATILAKIGATVVPLAGVLRVSSANVVVTVSFTHPYPVTFTESGLPTGTSWSLKVAGMVYTTSGSTIAVGLTNGSHAVSVGREAGYRHLLRPSPVRVLGAPLNVTVEFVPLRVAATVAAPARGASALADADRALSEVAAASRRAVLG